LIPSRCPGQLIKLSQGESGAQPPRLAFVDFAFSRDQP
jgi:hypothetical protein